MAISEDKANDLLVDNSNLMEENSKLKAENEELKKQVLVAYQERAKLINSVFNSLFDLCAQIKKMNPNQENG